LGRPLASIEVELAATPERTPCVAGGPFE